MKSSPLRTNGLSQCDTEHGRGLALRSVLWIALFGGGLLAISLGTRALTYHEVIFAEPAREMLATGQWLLPKHAGTPCNHKPPFTHWMIASALLATGSRSEWVVRLPSVLAAILTAIFLAVLAGRWFGNRAGLAAGLVQLTTVHVIRQARWAEPDMPLSAAMAAAMLAFATLVIDCPKGIDSPNSSRGGKWTCRAFYLASGLAFLIKGPVGLVLIGLGCGAYLIVDRRWDRVRAFLDPVGLAIFAACLLVWPLAAYAAYPPIANDWLLHHFGRFRGVLGSKPPLYYFYTIPAVMLPWTPLVLFGLVRGLRSQRFRQPIWSFLACWLLAGLVFLSACAFKRKHYSFPLLPPLSVVAACGMLDLVRRRYRKGAASPARRTLLNRQLAGGFALLWLVLAGVEIWTSAANDDYRLPRQWARRVNDLVPAGEPLYLVHMPENQIAYYLAPSLIRYDKDARFLRFAGAHSGVRYALTPRYVADRMSRQVGVVPLDRSPSSRQSPRERLVLVRIEAAKSPVATSAPGAPNEPTNTTSRYASGPSKRSSSSTGIR